MSARYLASPWEAFQPWDIERFGAEILNREEQERWSRATFLGGLTFMWGRADPIRSVIYDRLELKAGDRVLLLGEAVEPSGFAAEIGAIVGDRGAVEVIDIVEDARRRYFAREHGRDGQLATWRYEYASSYPDSGFDCVAVLQGVQHSDNWREAGSELLRIMRSGRRIVLTEIAFGPRFNVRVEADMHLEFLMTKIFERMGWHYREFAYHGPEELTAAFAGLVVEPGTFEWKGVELFWGRKS